MVTAFLPSLWGRVRGARTWAWGFSAPAASPPHLDTVQINEFLVTTAGPPRAAQPFPVRGLPGRGRGRLPAASLPLPGRARPSHNRDRSELGRAGPHGRAAAPCPGGAQPAAPATEALRQEPGAAAGPARLREEHAGQVRAGKGAGAVTAAWGHLGFL